jgi:hypothetical protein
LAIGARENSGLPPALCQPAEEALQMDATFWPIVAIGSGAAYAVVILAGYWIYQRGYRGN